MKKFDYTISKDNSPSKFKSACEWVQSKFPYYTKQELLVDVDGSTIQVFSHNGSEIVIYDDYDIGSVFIKSDVQLFDTGITPDFSFAPEYMYA